MTAVINFMVPIILKVYKYVAAYTLNNGNSLHAAAARHYHYIHRFRNVSPVEHLQPEQY